MKDERLAVTLERIAADPNTFYTGDLADDIGKEKWSLGGILEQFLKNDSSGRLETSKFYYHKGRFEKIWCYHYRIFDLEWPLYDVLCSDTYGQYKKNRYIQNSTAKIFIFQQRHRVARFYSSCLICLIRLNLKDWTKPILGWSGVYGLPGWLD